jgi:ParB family chromosome partitioning protein
MTKKSTNRGLGRGLSALLSDDGLEAGSHAASATVAPIERLRPNPDQPRKDFSDDEMQELAASIREKGVIQPLIVRPDPSGSGWQIVAGERRWRAAQKAQLHELPIIVRNLSDHEVLELAIIENVQRADLNPVEEAAGYAQLMENFGHTQEKLAEAMGKSRSYIANTLRLLTLPKEVLEFVRRGLLTAGHARALITSDNPAALARRVIEKRLSVRELEALVRAEKSAPSPGAKRHLKPTKDADTRALEADLTAHLGLKVSVDHKGGSGGEVRLTYRSLDELDGICRLLSS